MTASWGEIGSLLVTETILQVTALQFPAEAATVTGTSLWLGGHRALGLAVRESIVTGPVPVGVTVTVAVH
jgi:hypothetical protein